jgi:hypothetical protein
MLDGGEDPALAISGAAGTDETAAFLAVRATAVSLQVEARPPIGGGAASGN